MYFFPHHFFFSFSLRENGGDAYPLTLAAFCGAVLRRPFKSDDSPTLYLGAVLAKQTQAKA